MDRKTAGVLAGGATILASIVVGLVVMSGGVQRPGLTVPESQQVISVAGPLASMAQETTVSTVPISWSANSAYASGSALLTGGAGPLATPGSLRSEVFTALAGAEPSSAPLVSVGASAGAISALSESSAPSAIPVGSSSTPTPKAKAGKVADPAGDAPGSFLATYSRAGRDQVFRKMLSPLPRRNAPSGFLRCHGYYWFDRRAPKMGDLDRCRATWERMKGQYPVPVVMLNRTLLSDSETASALMEVFGDSDVLAWVDVDPTPGSLELLAGFLQVHGKRVCAVVLGGPTLEAGWRETVPEDQRGTDTAVWGLWLDFVHYSLPGRPVALLWHRVGPHGPAYNASILQALGADNVDGLCLWNYPSVWNWQSDRAAGYAKEIQGLLGRKGWNLAGDWTVDAPFVYRGGTPERRKQLASELVPQIAGCELNISKNFSGLVRCVGFIPNGAIIIEDAK